MIPRRSLLLFLAILTLISSLSAGPLPQAENGIFIKETGHWITGAFYDFWQEAPDPILLFGYPITDTIPHHMRQGVTVQYFQRARLELDPSQPEGQRVKLASLGAWMYDETQRGDNANFPINNSVCRLFEQNGKYVCYAFLQFYDRYDGAKYFGQPISDVENVDGRLVQYFEFARMEWRPERPTGQRVVLTEIGRIGFDITIGDPNLQNTYLDIPEGSLTEIKVYAFVARPLMPSGDQQKIYVVAYNQFHQPLKDVQVMVTVRYPNNRSENYRPDHLTDEDGLAVAVFTVDNVNPNEVVQVQVDASIPNGPQGSASTWFRIWW